MPDLFLKTFQPFYLRHLFISNATILASTYKARSHPGTFPVACHSNPFPVPQNAAQ
jgi:hypothetical protein